MTAAITVIPSTMADLMIANSAFNSALAIGVGPPYRVAKQFWPLITVIMLGEGTDAELTGNRKRRAYSGFVLVEAIVQDVLSVTARKFTVTSFTTVATLANEVKEFFSATAQLTLGSPTIDNGAVDVIELIDDIEYPEAQRENTFYSQATVSFVVYTWEAL